MVFLVSEPLLQVICDQDQSNHTSVDVITNWESYYDERVSVLVNIHRKKEPIDLYFNTFSCLCPPLGISLVSFL